MKSKFVKFLLWCGVFSLLGVVILWIEHGRCAAQLAAYQRTLTARGDKLTLRELLPPDPPAASNAAVVLSRVLTVQYSLDMSELPWMQLVSSNRARVAQRHNPLIEATASQTWEDLTRKANENHDKLPEVLQAASLPRLALLTRANLDQLMDGGQHTYQLHPLGEWLGLNALVAVREGRTNDAWEAWRAQLRLRSLVLNDPAIISDERFSRPVAFSVSWELLQRGGWTEPQLAEAQALWASCRHLRANTNDAQAGRVLIFQSYDGIRRQPAIVASMVAASASSPVAGMFFSGGNWWDYILLNPKAVWELASRDMPRVLAWPWWTSYGDELWLLREYDRYFATVESSVRGNAALPALVTLRATAQPKPSDWWPLARATEDFMSMEQAFLKTLSQEAQTRLATTAIAIHRYQSRKQRLPETLNGLVPEFLPRVPDDPMDGKPLRYQPQPDGTFLLYSIGDDGLDQGGDATERLSSIRSTVTFGSGFSLESRWQKGRDWIWPMAATAEETEQHAATLLKTRSPGPGLPLPPPPPPP